jgi:peptidase E
MGGAFLADPDGNLLLERYLKELTDRANPKILFVPTASGDNEAYSLRFFQAFTRLGCRPGVLPFFKRTPRNLQEFVLDHDAIAVGGGNTRTMLAVWRDWGLDAILKQAQERGIVLGGSSAGSICWFEEGVTDSIAGPLVRMPCLGFLKGSNCPHYDSEKERRPTYQAMVKAGVIRDGHAADDGVGLHYIDGEFIQAVSAKPRAMAWSVRRVQNGVVEDPIEPTRLG